MPDLLDGVIQPVRRRLKSGLMEADGAAMVAEGVKPNLVSKFADEFNPRFPAISESEFPPSTGIEAAPLRAT